MVSAQCERALTQQGHSARASWLTAISRQYNVEFLRNAKGRLFLSAYVVYQPGLLRAAALRARAQGVRVMLDLASWEVVKAFKDELQMVLAEGLITCCICNQDEGQELLGHPDGWAPEHTVHFLLQHCSYAVVTLGAKGCVAACLGNSQDGLGSIRVQTDSRAGLDVAGTRPGFLSEAAAGSAAGSVPVQEPGSGLESPSGQASRIAAGAGAGAEAGIGIAGRCGAAMAGAAAGAVSNDESMAKPAADAAGLGRGERSGTTLVLHEAAVAGVTVVDTTGAGDAFSSGFLYGLLRCLPLQKCARIGCLAGAAAVQVLGADLGPAEWQWLHQRLHSSLAASVIDNTPQEVYKELLDAYALVDRLGAGVVYFGSARLGQDSAFYKPVVQLARDVALLLGSTTWTGGGPGMMRAASEGALEAGRPVGAIKISREAGQASVRSADYLPVGASVVCRHMPTRKAALTDAGVRRRECQRTAFVFLPGGLGTMDELFAVLTLVQLNKLDTKFPVPVVCVNYDGFFDGLLAMLGKFDASGVMQMSELGGLHVAQSNTDVLDHLRKFYNVL